HQCRQDEDEIGHDPHERPPAESQPPPLDAEAQETQRAHDIGDARADRRGAQPGDELDLLDRPDEQQPQSEQECEPRQPRPQPSHGGAVPGAAGPDTYRFCESFRLRCGSTTYFGSLADWKPALNTDQRSAASPART